MPRRSRPSTSRCASASPAIPQAQRWLVSSEGAFSYLARDYGLKELYLWPINADEQGTPKQVKRVIDMVRKEKIPVVFSESTISDKPAKQVAKETGARYGGVLYVDSLSAANGPVPSYLKLLEVTVQTDRRGLRIVTTMLRAPNTGSGDARALAASISVRGVTVTYPNGTTALQDASFELGPGTICGLVGVNGSGKSTLFKAIMGFVTPSRGRDPHRRAVAARGAEAQPRRLRAAVGGRRLELPRPRRRRRDDGPLRPHGLPAQPLRRSTGARSTRRSSASA